MNEKEKIKNKIFDILNEYGITENEIIVEKPKSRQMGDYAIPCFTYAKKLRKSPIEIANLLKEKLGGYQTEVVNGYLNVFVNKNVLTKEVLSKIFSEKGAYGQHHFGDGKTIVIDYSSPNIAKPFGVGHLRSTVIGESLKRICQKCGYKVVGVNHLGDWGTQFGKLIYAYKNWGDEEALKEHPIDELKRIYVKFHAEAELNPELDEEGRKWFKALEEGDEEALRLWKWFKEVSLLEFEETYKLLGIDKFDAYTGESFYNDKMDSVIAELEQKNLLKLSDGAQIVDLGDLAPALIRRSDGATLYITRDLAAAFYRKKTYDFAESLYVVGNEQSLHFTQLKIVLDKMGYAWSKDMHHINFGLILQDGKKMSTRHGKSVKLHDVLVEAIDMAKKYIEEKNPTLENKEEVSRKIGVGAVIFNDLKNYRINDIEFNLDETLEFAGNTGPYIQYTYARISSLLENKKNIDVNYDKIEINEYIWNIVFSLYEFGDIIYRAKINFDPSEIAKYLIDLAASFNKFYANEKIIDEDIQSTEFKLLICEATSIIIKEGMNLLGIDVLNKM